MASFCANCGAPTSGPFCGACGARIQSAPPPAQSVAPSPPPIPPSPSAPAPAAGGSSLVKVIVIVVGVMVLLGGLGVASLVYVGYRAKQKLTELGQQYGVTSPATSPSAAPARSFPPSKGTGCPLLEGQEAAGILGVAVDRVEFAPHGPDNSEYCRYWVTAPERQRLEREEIAAGIKAAGKGDAKNSTEVFEKVIGGALGAVIDAAGDNKNEDFAFSLQVWRSDGRAMWDKMESAKSSVKGATGVDFAGLAIQPVEGVGDRATVLPGGHSIMVLKGDAFLLLGFQQFVPGRDKTAALARVAVGRI